MNNEFYPTPTTLLEKVFAGVNWSKVSTVLEPSGGKGDMADYILQAAGRGYHKVDVDCIEIDPNLRNVLKGKGFRVIHDDFLTFQTYKQYDLIAMNPPFSNGEEHLLKALELQKNGGYIICILNAETIRNPYSNQRKELCRRLEGASIEFVKDAFLSAERKTAVEVAVIRMEIPKAEQQSRILDELRQKHYARTAEPDQKNNLTVADQVEAIVQQYNMEVEVGVRLIQEYEAMKPYLMEKLQDHAYNHPILTMKIGNKESLDVNRFVKMVRKKYWAALFENPIFTGNMTSNLRDSYRGKVEELSDYDFSYYNIKTIQVDMSQNLIRGIEDCIIEIFDELSRQYAFDGETSKNIHYFNGWSTNKSWIINKKVILPFMNASAQIFHKYDPTRYQIVEKLDDIEKAMNYLSGRNSERSVYARLSDAKDAEQTKKVQLSYFTVTFYKKGTCHLEFTDLEILKKLNIFGSQKKGWLPPSYGKKKYRDMSDEEQAVINEFEGEVEYKKTLEKADFYIYDPSNSVLSLEMAG